MPKCFHKISYIFVLAGVLSSCTSSNNSTTTQTPTGPSADITMTVQGLSKFGSVVVGDYRETLVQVTNNTTGVSPIFPKLQAPFYSVNLQDPCSDGQLAAGQTCGFYVRFKPSTAGDFASSLTLGSTTINFSGKGLVGGDIAVSEYNINLGQLQAGVEVFHTLTLTNTGDYIVPFPTFDNITGFSISSNYCGAEIPKKVSCNVVFKIVKKSLGGAADAMNMTSTSQGSGTSIVPLGWSSTTVAGPPNGNIAFRGAAPILTADGQQFVDIYSDNVMDQFGNPVVNGTPVNIQLVNLTLYPSGSPATLATVNGKIHFQVKTTIKKGSSVVSVFSGNAYGSLPLYSRAGLPFGSISLLPYNSSVVADGQTQMGLRFATIYDENGNSVEDGTIIPLSVIGGGTLSSANVVYGQSINPTTYQGSTNFTLKAGTVIGNATIQLRANPVMDASGNITDYLAKADYPIVYVPGQPYGTIAISSLKGGINAVGEMSLITIGPVKDSQGNVVVVNTAVDVKITNGINASGTGSRLYTNSSGTVSFIVQGSGNRGAIIVDATSVAALGESQIWAYKDSHLTLQGQTRDDWGLQSGNNNINSGRAFIRYYAATSNPALFPQPIDVWDEVFDYNRLSSTDKTYYDIERLNGNPISSIGEAPGFTFPLNRPTVSSLPSFISYSGPATTMPLFRSPVFYSAGTSVVNAPFWSDSVPTGVSNLQPCSNVSPSFSSLFDFNSMVYNFTTASYSCAVNGKILTTNTASDRTDQLSRTNFYWPSVGYAEDPLGCSFDSAQSPSFNFNLGNYYVGDNTTRNIVINNTNPTDITNLTFSFGTTNPNWSYSNINCPATLPALGSCVISASFNNTSSTTVGSYSGALAVNSSLVSSTVILSSNIIASSGAETSDTTAIGQVVMKSNCYSKLITYGGYNYVMNTQGTQTVAQSSNVTASFNNRGQIITKVDNLCPVYSNPTDCGNGNGCIWQASGSKNADGTPKMECDNASALGSYPQKGKGFSPFVAVGRKLYQFDGFDPSGDGSISQDGLRAYDTESGTWSSLSPLPDVTIDPTNPSKGVPPDRYEHSLVYVPETTSLYMYGGMGASNVPGHIGNPITLNDLWQLNLYPPPKVDSNGNSTPADIKWHRVCDNCVQVSLANIFIQILRDPSNLGPGYTSDPGVSYMIWNKAHKKVYMYWLGKSIAYYFDPTATTPTVQPLDSGSGANFLAPSYQVFSNPRSSRMFAYSQGSPSGNPYYPPYFKMWDMDANEKTYFKARFNLGAGSKGYAQVITPRITAYGAAGPDAACGNPCPGISTYVYNYDKAAWDLVGNNTAVNDTMLSSQGETSFSWLNADAKAHISTTGYVDILVMPNGSPTEYNEMHIDSVYLDGTF